MIFVKELGVELSQRELDIYEGRSELTEDRRLAYVRMWQQRGKPKPVRAPQPRPKATRIEGDCGCGGKKKLRASSVKRNLEWIGTAQLIADSIKLAGLLPVNASGIAGIPRSGMVPASVIATHLHLPLYQLTEEGVLERLGHGWRGRELGFSQSSGPLVVVDDTVYGGNAMSKARASLIGTEAIFAAVYVRPEKRDAVDVFTRLLPSPHFLEWNMFNTGCMAGYCQDTIWGAGIATDLDGIICHDAESGGTLLTPYLVPRTHTCRLIVTGRPEADRVVTEELLRSIGCKWERLEMLQSGDIAEHKAKHFAASPCGLFIESDIIQAEKIAALSKKPVICPRAGKVFQ
jgi:hypothetical protein